MEILWRRVTISHVHEPRLAEQVKELLEFSGFAPKIAPEPSGGLPGIGAAVVFDERRIVLLVRGEVLVPEALRGVGLVRFTGATLDASETYAFLAAINALNSRPLSCGA